jgi:anti-sigma28 factor (negative regulator of flagellin synthesis)
MSDIASIGSNGFGSVGPVSRLNLHATSANGTPRIAGLDLTDTSGDRVEVSDVARFLDELRRLPSVRLDRIESIRQAIEAGAYETEQKLDTALDRLLSEEF